MPDHCPRCPDPQGIIEENGILAAENLEMEEQLEAIDILVSQVFDNLDSPDIVASLMTEISKTTKM
tara:strand:+ start:283 stop:480 length:198 start_codon:yes stop_codon:yes gene_type:complete